MLKDSPVIVATVTLRSSTTHRFLKGDLLRRIHKYTINVSHAFSTKPLLVSSRARAHESSELSRAKPRRHLQCKYAQQWASLTQWAYAAIN